MCGFVGIMCDALKSSLTYNSEIVAMNESLKHRGPDSSAYWFEEDGVLALGHRRLAIEDLSEAGSQPMHSPTGRYVIVYNGEIYNHREIRSEIEAKKIHSQWRGTSDTETLVASIEAFGIQGAIEKSVGMFALAIWDKKERLLTLVRDRMGEKPLYYGWCGESFVFASELRAIESIPNIKLNLDTNALDMFLRYTYVPGAKSIYREINKLTPSSILEVNPYKPKQIKKIKYWSLIDRVKTGISYPFSGDDIEARFEFERLLSKTVGRQMLADVQVGAFLSGGVDSAGVVSEMVAQSNSRVNTFTLGFGTPGYDETYQASQIAKHFGTAHHEAVISESEAMSIVPTLSKIYDEPFADSSQIPTILISRFARQYVTVALTGDGGDEIFGGYPRHSSAAKYFKTVQNIPYLLRSPLGSFVNYALDLSNNLDQDLRPSLNERTRKLCKFATVLKAKSLSSSYSEWVTHWRAFDKIIILDSKKSHSLNLLNIDTSIGDIDRELMLIDSLTYLVDEILVKVDRGAMSTSLETRAPYLDHELVQFACTLPKHLLMNSSRRKVLLRNIVESRLKPLSLPSTKTGFSVPLGSWLRNGLRDWAEDTLVYSPKSGQLLNETIIQKVWNQHLNGSKDNSSLLWSILMFKSWARDRAI